MKSQKYLKCPALQFLSKNLSIKPLVPDAHYNERQDKPFSLQIERLEADLKLNRRYFFIFCTLGTNGLSRGTKASFRHWWVKTRAGHLRHWWVNPLVPRVQKIKIRNFTLNRLLVVAFVKKMVYLGAHYSERQGLMG